AWRKIKRWRIKCLKIYNKKKLWSGVGSLALAVLLIVTMCIKGVRAKDIALVVVLLAHGLSQVSGAMSRQQTIEEREEGNVTIALKAKSRAFALTQNICLALTIVLIVGGAVKGQMVLLAMGVANGLVITVSTICEL